MQKIFKIMGREGHRQALSFGHTHYLTFKDGREIVVFCSDVTNTNDYVIVILRCLSSAEKDIYKYLQAQLDDGIFENYRYGDIFELVKSEDDIYGIQKFDTWKKINPYTLAGMC